jgi:hypothetical protein
MMEVGGMHSALPGPHPAGAYGVQKSRRATFGNPVDSAGIFIGAIRPAMPGRV